MTINGIDISFGDKPVDKTRIIKVNRRLRDLLKNRKFSNARLPRVRKSSSKRKSS